jgi:type I restriction enzyme S subunit
MSITEKHFGEFLTLNRRPHLLGPDEDANLVGVRWYGDGPFHREFKEALKIRKKSHFVIRQGDVIYNKLFAWKGSIGIVSSDLDGMFVSDKFPTYQLDESQVYPQFLYWYVRIPQLWEQAKRLSTGSAAISKLTLNPPKFLDLTIPAPPLPEQKLIAAKIDDLAQQIHTARSLRQKAAEESAILSRTITSYLTDRVSVDGTLGDVLLAKPRNGWSPRCDNATTGTPVLSLGSVTGFEYRATEFKRTSLPTVEDAHYWLRPGDLLMSRSNTPELVGHAAIYNGSPSPCIYPDLTMRLEVNPDRAAARFVWYWAQTPLVRDYIKQNAKGTSPTMKKISQGIVMAIPFPASLNPEKQTQMVAHLDKVRESVSSLSIAQRKTSHELDALLPSILDRAFKGEL